MSGGLVFRQTLAHVSRLGLAPEGERDLLVALERGHKVLPAIYSLSLAPGLDRDLALRRAVAAYYVHCTGNLADDLADGECNYFAELPRVAPIVQFTLHNALICACVDADLSPSVIREATRLLAVAASAGSIELRTKGWTESRYRQVGEAIAGDQWVAIALVLWGGTELEKEAPRLGQALGGSSFLLSDLISHDQRFFSMSVNEQRRIRDWAESLLASVQETRWPPVNRLAGMIAEQLETYREHS